MQAKGTSMVGVYSFCLLKQALKRRNMLLWGGPLIGFMAEEHTLSLSGKAQRNIRNSIGPEFVQF